MSGVACSGCKVRVHPEAGAHKAHIMFVGLSAKPGTEALCASTNSGRLIGEIAERIGESLAVHKTNLVKCAPLGRDGKLRYPSSSEMQACLPRLLVEIDYHVPRVIVPLGGQVSRFLLDVLLSSRGFKGFRNDFSYDTFSFAGGFIVPVQHPSYVWIYRRKRITEYVDGVARHLRQAVSLT